ncbi:MAG: hypothetical protein AABX33_00220 [Nanoarchaeota archaeon]
MFDNIASYAGFLRRHVRNLYSSSMVTVKPQRGHKDQSVFTQICADNGDYTTPQSCKVEIGDIWLLAYKKKLDGSIPSTEILGGLICGTDAVSKDACLETLLITTMLKDTNPPKLANRVRDDLLDELGRDLALRGIHIVYYFTRQDETKYWSSSGVSTKKLARIGAQKLKRYRYGLGEKEGVEPEKIGVKHYIGSPFSYVKLILL